MKSKSFFTAVVSILLIGLGVLLILANFDVISFEISDVIAKNWPLIIVLLGLKWLIDGLRPSLGGSWTAGSFVAIYGTLIVLGNHGIVDFGFGDIWTLWPLLLVYIGIHSLMFTKNKGKRGHGVKVTVGNSDEPVGKNHKTFIGDQSFAEENWTVEPIKLWTGVGDYYFDFTKAYIPEEDTPIFIKGWVGDIRMLMPENLAFKVKAQANVGDIKVLDQKSEGLRREVVYQTPDYEEAEKKLTINLQFQVGDIRIDRV